MATRTERFESVRGTKPPPSASGSQSNSGRKVPIADASAKFVFAFFADAEASLVQADQGSCDGRKPAFREIKQAHLKFEISFPASLIQFVAGSSRAITVSSWTSVRIFRNS